MSHVMRFDFHNSGTTMDKIQWKLMSVLSILYHMLLTCHDGGPRLKDKKEKERREAKGEIHVQAIPIQRVTRPTRGPTHSKLQQFQFTDLDIFLLGSNGAQVKKVSNHEEF